MAACSVCNRDLGFFGSINNRFQRCKQCGQRLGQIQQQMLSSLEQTFPTVGISPIMEQGIIRGLNEARMPPDLGDPVLIRCRYLRALTDIRNGNVPRIATSIHLDSDEYAHFEMWVIYFKPLKRVKEIPGRLIGTNKKCYLISDTGADSATIDWNNVSQVYEQTIQVPRTVRYGNSTQTAYQPVNTLHIAVSKGSGGGDYSVADFLFTKIMIDTLVRLWKRQLVLYSENKTLGSVPDHVKAAVFHRDQGRCMQCGYEGPYIEYDHRIPRSKGGQNTVENIQLLCRMCNLKKSDKI